MIINMKELFKKQDKEFEEWLRNHDTFMGGLDSSQIKLLKSHISKIRKETLEALLEKSHERVKELKQTPDWGKSDRIRGRVLEEEKIGKELYLLLKSLDT